MKRIEINHVIGSNRHDIFGCELAGIKKGYKQFTINWWIWYEGNGHFMCIDTRKPVEKLSIWNQKPMNNPALYGLE